MESLLGIFIFFFFRFDVLKSCASSCGSFFFRSFIYLFFKVVICSCWKVLREEAACPLKEDIKDMGCIV